MGGIRCKEDSPCQVRSQGGSWGSGCGMSWWAQGGKKGGKGGKGKGGGSDKMSGHWTCPGCGHHELASNTECSKCGKPNPRALGQLAAKKFFSQTTDSESAA